MFSHLYVRRGVVYIPTVGLSENGLYVDVDPVEVVAATDSAGIQAAIERTLARGQPRVPTPKPPFAAPVVLKHANVRTWGQFERGTTMLGIKDKDGRYQMIHYQPIRGHGWAEDPGRAEVLSADTGTADVARRVAEIVCTTA